jgi:hypothetical protein
MSAYHVEAENIDIWTDDARITFTPQDGAETLSGAFAPVVTSARA